MCCPRYSVESQINFVKTEAKKEFSKPHDLQVQYGPCFGNGLFQKVLRLVSLESLDFAWLLASCIDQFSPLGGSLAAVDYYLVAYKDSRK